MIGLNKIGLNQVQLNRLYLNAPFPVYRKMTGGGSSGDGFPVLPGDVTRWHFGGLTNEMMAAMDDPRIEDADHKGRFLSFKNFLWGGMSGVNGYMQNFNDFRNSFSTEQLAIDEKNSSLIKVSVLVPGVNNSIYIPKDKYQFGKSYYLRVSSEGYNEEDLSLLFYANASTTSIRIPLNPNGITEIPAVQEDDYRVVYITVNGKIGSLTIEQLPLYPGFILGDGVDDFAVTDKELNFEDTYTVYTAFIPFQDDPARNMILCGKDHTKDFYMNYSNLSQISFYSSNKFVRTFLSNGFNLFCCKRSAENMIIKNLLTGNSATVTATDLIDNPGLYYLWKSATNNFYSKVAIAGQIIDNGHFTTDEEDEKVLNWHKKQYPWLFPNQAWTVTGKTNEDTDRATIANITGNGNNLVLSNFGFAENSGYGLYGDDFFKWLIHENRVVATKTSKLFNITSIKEAVLQLYYQSTGGETVRTIPSYTIKVTGLTDGQKIIYKNNQTDLVSISSDGIHKLPSFEFLGAGSYYGFAFTKVQESCDITIEQIPEYEGYIVTDGVDDSIQSKRFLLHKNWTMVGDWRFIPSEKNSNSGIVKSPALRIYNQINGITIYINRSTNPKSISDRSIKAVCSDGRIYLDDWSEFLDTELQTVLEDNNVLSISNYGVNYTKMIFKNLSFYDNHLFSKEDCIKAYNYLQTLKAK